MIYDSYPFGFCCHNDLRISRDYREMGSCTNSIISICDAHHVRSSDLRACVLYGGGQKFLYKYSNDFA